ncbi:Na/Pi symporter [Peribacillus psychrosaccharolyticus]|nr:Na/Pi symporter [Peribacillus psychrosaccharolyticus]MEC2054337.1 Na/Pi symporter [Peribacillus psychrosaccharolyticus]MED3744435.1 Na/Pi symporter [Peribacillus psychrosaccharolyticus]
MQVLLLFFLYIIMFLTGMFVLRIGLFNAAGERLKSFLALVTNKPWKGFLAGIFFTGILQSSSAVMVMAVGLVAARALTFPQTIGIILGTNIGSTFTTEFMAFPMDRWIVPGIILGALLWLIPHHLPKSIGTAFIGISAIFAAMGGFKTLAGPLAAFPAAAEIITLIENHLGFALLIGVTLTAIIHSSSATVGLAMSFVAAGDLSVASAIVIMLGSNIGTCITGYMASIGSGREATLTAYSHIWLNFFGVLSFLPFIGLLENTTAYFTTEKALQLAHASLLFNLITSLAVLPFAKQYSRFILRIHGGRISL